MTIFLIFSIDDYYSTAHCNVFILSINVRYSYNILLLTLSVVVSTALHTVSPIEADAPAARFTRRQRALVYDREPVAGGTVLL